MSSGQDNKQNINMGAQHNKQKITRGQLEVEVTTSAIGNLRKEDAGEECPDARQLSEMRSAMGRPSQLPAMPRSNAQPFFSPSSLRKYCPARRITSTTLNFS
mmetsp:Transcript_95047/g.306114  ORF Transcript_95047/g.306114 Transcript_95047/m.306114 type:complete len:102 (+) Transcript_95047:77-382(+)